MFQVVDIGQPALNQSDDWEKPTGCTPAEKR
jgi:hypothetical protein